MRRGMERRQTHRREEGIPAMALNIADRARDLQELINALDRRLPNMEQAGEVSIARDAAALRAKAVDRLAELMDLEQQSVSAHAQSRP